MIEDATKRAILRRAMLPMDGNIAEHAEGILAATARVVPRDDWPALTCIDLTAGSCMLPLSFAAAGVRRVVINDIATRTIVAARGLFQGGPVDRTEVERILDRRKSQRRPHTPSFNFASDYLTAEICDVFDRLFHADVTPPAAATLRYLALRHVLDFADPDDGFRILMTQDRKQLLADSETNWRDFVARIDAGPERLMQLLVDITAGQSAIATRDVTIHHGDMRDVAGMIDFRLPCLVVVNPPTNGVDEYVVDDQVVHSLIANRLVPLTRCPETPELFWRRGVEAALAALPSGALFVVWGGDGAMPAAACRGVWEGFGDPLHLHEVRAPGEPVAMWGIFRRR